MRKVFVFVPTVRERNPLQGHETRDRGTIWEVRSIPGNLVGVGKTPNAAVARLVDLIKWTREEEPDFEAWYRDSWAHADSGDEELFGRFMTELHRMLKQPKEINEQVAYGLVPCPA